MLLQPNVSQVEKTPQEARCPDEVAPTGRGSVPLTLRALPRRAGDLAISLYRKSL
jgi:hypothetical protein